jgi:hypothetical protein
VGRAAAAARAFRVRGATGRARSAHRCSRRGRGGGRPRGSHADLVGERPAQTGAGVEEPLEELDDDGDELDVDELLDVDEDVDDEPVGEEDPEEEDPREIDPVVEPDAEISSVRFVPVEPIMTAAALSGVNLHQALSTFWAALPAAAAPPELPPPPPPAARMKV